MMNWFSRLGNAISQLLNVLFFNGSEDETISSRIGKIKRANNDVMPLQAGWVGFWFYWIHQALSNIPRLRTHFFIAIEEDEGL